MLKLAIAALLAPTVLGVPAPQLGRCNPEELASIEALYLYEPAIDEAVPLTLLPITGDDSPACLDGTPYGFYFQPSKTGSTKWTVSINGGAPPANAQHSSTRRFR